MDINYDKLAIESHASQDKVELAGLLRRVAKIDPKVILEIGSWRGHFLKTCEQAFPSAELLIGIELDGNNIEWMKENVGISSKTYIVEGVSYGKRTKEIMNSVLLGMQIDFLFIDADHTYDGVKLDFLEYLPLVRKGGIIAFHDMLIINHPQVEVYKLWEEIRHDYKHVVLLGDGAGTGTGILYL